MLLSAAAAGAAAPYVALETRNAGVGNSEAPRLQSFVASDPDGGDRAYGVGDVLTITFAGRSNRGAHRGGKDHVDSLFAMVPSLGASYTGEWIDASTFQIDVLAASNALSDYSNAYMTVPSVLTDTRVVCQSFNRGAGAAFPDVDREFVLALNGYVLLRLLLLRLLRRRLRHCDCAPSRLLHAPPAASLAALAGALLLALRAICMQSSFGTQITST